MIGFNDKMLITLYAIAHDLLILMKTRCTFFQSCCIGLGRDSSSDGWRSALKQAFRSRILRKQAKMEAEVNQFIQALTKSQPMTLDDLEQRTTDALNKLFDDFTQITSEIEDKIQCGHDKTCHNNRKTSDDETFHNTKITEPQNININDLLGMENFDWLFTRVWTQKEENEPDTEKEAFVMDDQSGSGHVMSEPQAQPKLTVKVPYQRKHTRESYATSNAKMLHTGRSNNHTRREDKNYSNHGYSEKEMEYSGQHSVQLGKQNRSRNSNSGQYVPNLTRNTLEFYESEGTNFDTSIFETDEEKLNRELWLEEEKYYYDFSDFKMPERDYIPTESEMNGEIYVSEPTHVLNDYSNFKTGHARTYEYSVKDNESLKITGKRQQLPLNKDEITDLQGIVEMLGKLFDDLSVNADEDVDADDVEEALHKANRIDKGKEKGRKNKESETKVPKCGCGKQGQMLEENSGMQKHDQNKSDQDSIVNCLDNYECRWKLLNF